MNRHTTHKVPTPSPTVPHTFYCLAKRSQLRNRALRERAPHRTATSTRNTTVEIKLSSWDETCALRNGQLQRRTRKTLYRRLVNMFKRSA